MLSAPHMQGPSAPAWVGAGASAWQQGQSDPSWTQPSPADAHSRPLVQLHALPDDPVHTPLEVDPLTGGNGPFSSLSDPWSLASAPAPFGTDLQPPQNQFTARSLRSMPTGMTGGPLAGAARAAPWDLPAGNEAGSAPAPRSGGMVSGPCRLAAALAGGGPDVQAAAQQAAERKRALYKAELEQQMLEKAERRRQVPAALPSPVCGTQRARLSPVCLLLDLHEGGALAGAVTLAAPRFCPPNKKNLFYKCPVVPSCRSRLLSRRPRRARRPRRSRCDGERRWAPMAEAVGHCGTARAGPLPT